MNINFNVLSRILADIEQQQYNQTGEIAVAMFEYCNDKSGCIEFYDESTLKSHLFLMFINLNDLKSELESRGFDCERLFDTDVSMENLDKALETIEKDTSISSVTRVASLIYCCTGQGKISFYDVESDDFHIVATFGTFEEMESKLRYLGYL